jgi:hypothetical protein
MNKYMLTKGKGIHLFNLLINLQKREKGERGEGCIPGARGGGGLEVAEGRPTAHLLERGERGLIVEGAPTDTPADPPPPLPPLVLVAVRC